jgi:bacteriocin biosynthesis cyclodehydratase domain-containing protein
MVLRLDPRIPLVWRDPFSLQFGVTDPVTVLRDVSAADERMISALTTGISRSGLEMIGRASGATERDVDRLVTRLGPALESDDRPVPATVVIAGSGPTVVQLAADLGATGTRVRVAAGPDAAASEDCDLAIVVSAFVIAPEYHALWLRRDVPHLPVVIGDTAVSVGPVVEPGTGPCLYCLNRYRVEEDAAWPAIATQLLGRRAAAESPLVASEAAALASRAVTRRLRAGGAASVHTEWRLDMSTGAVTTIERLPHPDCGCIDLGATA